MQPALFSAIVFANHRLNNNQPLTFTIGVVFLLLRHQANQSEIRMKFEFRTPTPRRPRPACSVILGICIVTHRTSVHDHRCCKRSRSCVRSSDSCLRRSVASLIHTRSCFDPSLLFFVLVSIKTMSEIDFN